MRGRIGRVANTVENERNGDCVIPWDILKRKREAREGVQDDMC